MDYEEQEIKLSDIMAVFKKQWKFIIIPSIAVALIAFGYVKTLPKSYESYSLVRIGGSQTKPFESIGTINAIMQSYPQRAAIVQQMKSTEPPNTPEALEDLLVYTDESGLLKISAAAASPVKAAELVNIATSLTVTRHQQLLVEAKTGSDALVEYVKSTVKPVSIISTSITEYRYSPSVVEIPAVVSKKPVASKNKTIPVAAFFLVFFIMTLSAFYRQSSAGVVAQSRQ